MTLIQHVPSIQKTGWEILDYVFISLIGILNYIQIPLTKRKVNSLSTFTDNDELRVIKTGDHSRKHRNLS